eukprot:5935423-Pyramimonas_sp.AAC.1
MLKPGAYTAFVISPCTGIRLLSGVRCVPFSAFTISSPARAIMLGVMTADSSPGRANASEYTIRLRFN